ncbi:hypothetical protein F4775DRAFT_607659 [Biscogniauxia sp. FL1348]|nr:hypothetical protein F4775DRAFT_607659 [Biscogniauxia sp. FL1348]
MADGESCKCIVVVLKQSLENSKCEYRRLGNSGPKVSVPIFSCIGARVLPGAGAGPDHPSSGAWRGWRHAAPLARSWAFSREAEHERFLEELYVSAEGGGGALHGPLRSNTGQPIPERDPDIISPCPGYLTQATSTSRPQPPLPPFAQSTHSITRFPARDLAMPGTKKTCSYCKKEYDGLDCPFCIRDGGFRGDEEAVKDTGKDGDGGKKDDGEKK